MKKLFMILFLVMAIFGVVSSQSITVLTPKQGSVLCNDCQMMIVWSKSGNMNNILKIRLFNSSGTVMVANINSYFDSKDKNYIKWTISGPIKGGMYFVRVKTIDGGVAIINSGYTDGDRTIKVTVLDVDRTQADALDDMQQNTTIINLSMDDGFYSAAIKSSDVKNGKAVVVIYIKEKLSA